MKKKKSLIVEHDFFWENSFVFGVFGSRRGLQDKYIHTYIHTLLARPHGAFQSQFYITKIINQVHDNKNITMIKEDKGQ